MKKFLFIILSICIYQTGVTARIVEGDYELDGYIYYLYDTEEYSRDRLFAVMKDVTDVRYAEFCETHELRLPSTIEYGGKKYLVSVGQTWFKHRDFNELELITFSGHSLGNLNNFPKLKRIITEYNLRSSCVETMTDLPSLQELELSTIPPETGRRAYIDVRNSFINLGIERLSFSENSGLEMVSGSFCSLPNLEELRVCYIDWCHDSFQHLPKVKEITFASTPYDLCRSFVDLPMLRKITLKKWGDPYYSPLHFGSSVTCAPLLKDVYVEEAIPCNASFSQNPEENGVYPPRLTLHVPIGSRELYAAADGWKDFGEIVEYDPAGVDSPEADAETNGWSCNATGGSVSVSAHSDVEVEILTPAGTVVKHLAMAAGETASVELPAGVYIVAANGQSEKVCVR